MSYNPKYKLKGKVVNRYIPGQSKVIAEQDIRQSIPEQPDTANWYKGIEIKPKFESSKSDVYTQGVNKQIPVKEIATETIPYVNDERTIIENGQMKQVPVYTTTPQRKLSLEDYSSEFDNKGNIVIPEKRIDNSIANKVNTAVYNSLNATGIDPASGMGTVLASVMNPLFTGLEQMQRGNNEEKIGREITDNILGLATIGIGTIPSMIGVNSLIPAITEFSGNIAENLGMEKQTGEKIGHLISFAPFGSKIVLAGLTSTTAGEFVSKLLEDKEIDETDKERIIETAHHIGFFGGLGAIGLTKGVYKNLKDRADINSLSPEKLTPQRLQNAISEEIQKDTQRQIVQTLDKDLQTAKVRFEKAETPEERLKTLDTIEKIDAKKTEYEAKETEQIEKNKIQEQPEEIKPETKPIDTEKVPVEKPELTTDNKLDITEDNYSIENAKLDIEKAKILKETSPETAELDSGIKTKKDYDRYIEESEKWIDKKTKEIKAETKPEVTEKTAKELLKLPETKLKPETPESQKFRIGRSPLTYSLIERLPFNPKTDLPDEKYVKIRNDKTGETFVSLESDLKPVKESKQVDVQQHKIDLIDKKIKRAEKLSKGNEIAKDEARIIINKLKTKREQLTEKIEPIEEQKTELIKEVNPEVKEDIKTEMEQIKKSTELISNIENVLIENPRSEIPKVISEKIKSDAENKLEEIKDAEIVRQGSINTIDPITGESKGTSPFTISGFPKWFSELGQNKKSVINALNKIIEDKGKDKGVMVEKVKAKILEHLAEGKQDSRTYVIGGEKKISKGDFTPPDKDVTDFLEQFKKGTITKKDLQKWEREQLRNERKQQIEEAKLYREEEKNKAIAEKEGLWDIEYEQAKKTLKEAKKGNTNFSMLGMGKLDKILQPEVFKAVYTIGKYHTGKFSVWTKKVIADVGNWIRPHLKSLWNELTKDRTGLENFVMQGIGKIKSLPKEFKNIEQTPEFKEWYKDSKVRDENNNPIMLYSGHSNVELYNSYNPKKSTAGGFYASESPDVASGYALTKWGRKEYYDMGSEYLLEGKNGKLNKKIWQYELSDKQKSIIDEIKNADEDSKDYNNISIQGMERYINENKKYDKDAQRMSYRGGIYNLHNIYTYLEHMGYNIAYDIPNKIGEQIPSFLRQRKTDFDSLLDRLGIKWNRYDWEQPGVFPVYLNITKPIDADKPFPQDLLNALYNSSKYERKVNDEYWTKDYSLKKWVNDIKEGDEYWTTQIPKKALPIIKSYGYDGIKEVGLKGSNLPREERHINWIAFDKEQILNKFDYDFLKAKNSLQEKLNRANMTFGLDTIPELYTIGKYHFTNGITKFAEWSKKMIEETGNKIKPFLRQLWNELTKDRTGLENVVTQGISPKNRKTIISENLQKVPEPKVKSVKDLSVTDRKTILASDIFTKGSSKTKEDVFNYGNFTESEQINKMIQQSAKDNKPLIDEQKRDIRSWVKTQEASDMLRAMGWNEKALLNTVKGDSFLTEKILASKDIVHIAGKELLKAMKELPEGVDAKVELADKFLKYNALVTNLKGLISESGRALNIARMKSAEDVKVKIELADELIKLGLNPNDITGLNKALEIIQPTFKDKYYYWWYNSMLSNPLTDVANITGNLSHLGFELFRTAVTEKPATTIQIMKDLRKSHFSGVEEVKKIFKLQETTDSKFDYNERKYAESFNPVSKIGKRIKSVLPTTRLSMEDAYFRNLFGALRKHKTLQEISKETNEPVNVVEKLINDVYQNPDLKKLDEKFEIYDKHLKALERFIDYGVFQAPLGKGGSHIQKGLNKIPLLKAIMPFMKIAVNLTKTGIRITPYGLKDLITKKDITSLEKKDIVTRALLGTTFFGGLAYLMANDLIEITGHGVDDKDKRELWYKQGYKENHFYIKVNGEKYGFSYTNINPVNTVLSLIGSYSDDLKYNQTLKDDEKTFSDKFLKAMLGMVEVLTTQSFMQGIGQTVNMIRTNDPEGIKRSLQNLVLPSGLSFPKDIYNYYRGEKPMYETKTFSDRLKNKIGMTEDLKPALNQFGEHKSSTFERFPLPVSELKPDDELTKFLTENDIEISYPSKSTKLNDFQMTPEQYYEYNRIGGAMIKETLLSKLNILKTLKTKEEKSEAVKMLVDEAREETREIMTGKKTKEQIEKEKNTKKYKKTEREKLKEKIGLEGSDIQKKKLKSLSGQDKSIRNSDNKQMKKLKSLTK